MYALACGDEITAKVGEEILKEGGNAFDSAVASCFTATVCEPALTSAGGGGLLTAIVEEREAIFVDFFVNTPLRKEKTDGFLPVVVDFGSAKQTFFVGGGSVAVPGFVEGLLKVHSLYGKLPLKVVLEPVIELLKSGVKISERQRSFLKLLAPIFVLTEESKKLYSKMLAPTYKNENYAEFLEAISSEGLEFYRNEFSKKAVETVKKYSGILTEEDFKRYEVKVGKPVEENVFDFSILTAGYPSVGGSAVVKILKESSKFFTTERESKEYCAFLVESLKAGLSVIKRQSGNTTHLCVMDSDGNVVSVTTTNGENSGIVVEEFGIMLNNMLGEEILNPDGFFSWTPGKRLPSLMSPSITLKGGKFKLALGSAGSNRIASAVSQVILNFHVFGRSLEEAVSLPRLHFEDGTVFLEPGFDKECVEELKKRYKVVEFPEKNLFFGGVQSVAEGFKAKGDERRGGVGISKT